MRFIESILFENGQYHRLDLHQQRIDKTIRTLGGSKHTFALTQMLPYPALEGKHKARLVYDVFKGGMGVELSAYVPRNISKLKVMHSAPFDYSLKYEDRGHILSLLRQSGAEDILISLEGHLTDSSYSNVAFWDGDKWWTPYTPLLKGVRRQSLLASGRLHEAPIKVEDITRFEKVSLINAMLDLGELEVSVDNIHI